MAGHLLDLMPPHREYVEVFGGGASLLFAKQKAVIEVYNDLDGGLVHFFRVLRDPLQSKLLIELLDQTLYSRKEHIAARAWADEEEPVERARKWFILARQSFGGNFYGNSWGFGVSGESGASPVGNYVSARSLLTQASARLKDVQIECVDWRRVLEIYNHPTTLIYCDPPYLPETRKSGGYEHELTREDHEELLITLDEFPGMVMLSGYDNPLYRNLDAIGWQRETFETACMTAGRTRNSKLQGKGAVKAQASRTEIVWRNPAAMAAWQTLKTTEMGLLSPPDGWGRKPVWNEGNAESNPGEQPTT